MNSNVTNLKGIKGSQKWKALLVLVMLMCFGAGEAWAWNFTIQVVGGGSVQYYRNGTWRTVDDSFHVQGITGSSIKVKWKSTDSGYTWRGWTSTSGNYSGTDEVSVTNNLNNGTLYANFSKDTWEDNNLSSNTYTVESYSVSEFTVKRGSDMLNDGWPYKYIGNLTLNSGTTNIAFNNTNTVTMTGKVTLNGGTLNCSTGSNAAAVTLKRSSSNTGFLFDVYPGSTLKMSGSSSTKHFVIDGNGSNVTAEKPMIGCSKNDNSSSSDEGCLQLNYVTIQNGMCTGQGCAVQLWGASSTLKDMVITNCGGKEATAICLAYSSSSNTMSLENVVIHHCTAGPGGNKSGIIRAFGTTRCNLTMTRCNLYNNTLNTGSGTILWAGSGTLTMKGCELHDNNALSGKGAGLYCDGKAILMEAGEKNNPNNPWTPCKIHNNTAMYGGGIAQSMYTNENTSQTGTIGSGLVFSGTNNDLTIQGETEIYDNTATENGGGIWMQTCETVSINGGNPFGFKLVIDGAKIYDNNSKDGAGIYYDGTVVSSGATNGTDTPYERSVEIKAGTMIQNNNATNVGGGIYITGKGTDFTISGGTIGGLNNEGNSGKNTAISGGGIYIYGENSKATISSGEISKNEATSGNGGGVYIEGNGAQVSISGGKVLGNTAKSGVGGGFYAKNATVEISDGTIGSENNGNEAKSGGGFYIEGPSANVTLTGNSIISYNSATSGNGGGIYVDGSGTNSTAQISVTGGKVFKNTASSGYGGGFYAKNAKVTVSNGTIGGLDDSNNEAGNTATFGGGFYVEGPSANVSVTGNSIISYNSATSGNGGGIYVDGSGTNSTAQISVTGGKVLKNTASSGYGGGFYAKNAKVTISDGTIGSENYSNIAKSGGGFYIEGASADVTLTGNSIISYNSATSGNGGGIYVDGSGTNSTAQISVTGGKVFKNTASSGYGGGFYAKNAKVTVSSGTIGGVDTNDNSLGNSAKAGAGMYITGNSAEALISGGTVSYNNATNDGGGIYLTGKGASTTIDNGSIIQNISSTGNGGGIYVTGAGSSAFIKGGSVNKNAASSGLGGGIYLTGGTVEVNNGTVGGNNPGDGNKAMNGGGIYVKDGSLNVAKGKVQQNQATENGGGFYIEDTDASADSSFVSVSGGSITKNTAVNGAGFYINGSDVEVNVTNGTIGGSEANKNTASTNGGAFYVEKGSLLVDGGTTTYNMASNGGGIYNDEGQITIDGGTVSYNKASQNGGGVYNNAKMDVTGGKINNNEAIYGGGVYAYNDTVNFSNGEINYNFASTAGGGMYINDDAILNLNGEATLSRNHVPTGKVGGGVYLNGILVVGSTSRADDEVMAKDNFAFTTDTPDTYTITNQTRNNVYLPFTEVRQDHHGVITVNYNTITTTGSEIGFSVKQNHVPVIYCPPVTSDPDLTMDYLDRFTTGTGHDLNTVLFDDTKLYKSVHYSDRDIFDRDHVYLYGFWPEVVTTKPEGFTVDSQDENIVTISSSEGLAWLISYVNGMNGEAPHPNVEATLTQDVNMSDFGWVPIGFKGVSGVTPAPFSGTFNGNGHVIDSIVSNVYGNGDEGYTAYGLFGNVVGGTVSNVFLKDAEFLLDQADNLVLGSVIGEMSGNNATLVNSESSAKLVAKNPNTIVGGLVGRMGNDNTEPTIHSSCAMVEMDGGLRGGLVGQIVKGKLLNSFANAKFTSTTAGSTGGLVGTNAGTVENCYVRLQQGSATPTGWFAANNTGTINYCYAPSNATGIQSGTNGTYGDTGLLNGKYGFGQNDQQVSASNDHVENGAIDNTGELKGLLATLNNWVEAQTDGVAYSNWTRTMASPINDDYPILEFDDFVCAGSTDNVFIAYKDNLNDMIAEVNDNTNGGSIYLYGSNPVEVDESTGDNVRVYIPEHIGLKQADNNTINARVGVTFDNSSSNFMAYDWHMFASPLASAPLGLTNSDNTEHEYGYVVPNSVLSLSTDGYFPTNTPLGSMDFYCYSEKDYHWINFKRNSNDHWHQETNEQGQHDKIIYNNETNLTQGKGYMMAVNQPTMLMADGELTNSTVEIGVTYTSGALDFNGTNLIGNPYQSYLDFDAFCSNTDNANAGINIYYILDADQKGYLAYTAGASPQPAVEGTKGVASRFIHPHQGFFVKVDGNASAKFTTGMRKTLADVEAAGETSNFRGARIAYPLVNLKCTDSEGRNDFSTVEVNRPEQGGGEKALGLHTGNASIWAHVGDTDYHTAFATEGTTMVPVRFKAYDDDTFTLSWNTQNGDFNYLHLIDNITGMDVDCLTTDQYVFEGKTDDYLSRFKLVFGQGNEDEEDASTGSATFAFIMGDELVVNGEGLLQVFDMNGRQMVSTQLHGVQSIVSLPDVANGVYLMHLTNNNQVKTQKMVINK